MKNVQQVLDRLHWLGHDSFRLEGTPVIYLDPWKLKGKQPPADLVLVSNEHYDHCSPEDIGKIRKPTTIIVANPGAAEKLPGARAMRPGDRLSVAGVEIEAVPAYNVNKFKSPGVHFHPKEAGHVGYVLTVDGVRLYFAGDTDHIPEMAGIQCDVALLPVSGIYVMTAEEAAAAARDVNAPITVPMHCGAGIGPDDAPQMFARLYDGQVKVLKQE